jgi:hypothetical protein
MQHPQFFPINVRPGNRSSHALTLAAIPQTQVSSGSIIPTSTRTNFPAGTSTNQVSGEQARNVGGVDHLGRSSNCWRDLTEGIVAVNLRNLVQHFRAARLKSVSVFLNPSCLTNVFQFFSFRAAIALDRNDLHRSQRNCRS